MVKERRPNTAVRLSTTGGGVTIRLSKSLIAELHDYPAGEVHLITCIAVMLHEHLAETRTSTVAEN